MANPTSWADVAMFVAMAAVCIGSLILVPVLVRLLEGE